MYYNPYQQPQFNSFSLKQEIVKVNGEPGARAYQIAPNSSALLLDTTAPLVWLVQSDGAGYKTITAYNITPRQEEPAPSLSGVEERLSRLEEQINELKSNNTSPKSTKKAAE